jgi:predicted ATPase
MIFTYVLTGAHGTGKSSLLKELRSVPGYSFSESVTRKSGADINQSGNDEGQLKILAAIIDAETKNGIFKKDFILDRSFIDFYAYTRYLYNHNQVSIETLTLIESEFDKRASQYTMVFYLPIEFDIEQDGTRSDDIQFQKEIDDIIKLILIGKELTFVPVTGSLDERVSYIKTYIPFIGHVSNKTTILDTINDKELEEFLDDDNYVIYHSSTIVGLLSYKKTDRLKISYLYTDPNYRNVGLARRLMDKLLADSKGMIVYLYIKDEAMPFYKAYGIDKFIIGESIYSGSILNHYATFLNTDILSPIEVTDVDQARLKG